MNDKVFTALAKRLLIAVACLLYLISPLDFVPDVIPILGLLDDLAVMGVGAKKMLDVSKE